MLQEYIKIIFVIFVISTIAACASQSTKDKDQAATGDEVDVPEYYNEAIAAAKQGKTERAIVLFERITKANPDYAIAFTYLGLQYLQKGNIQAAELVFKKALAINSSDFVAYNHAGVIERMQGDFSGAKKMYQTAIDLKPDYANAHLNIAVLYDIYLYDLEQAMTHYKIYQSLTGNSDDLVTKWVVDLERRIDQKTK